MLRVFNFVVSTQWRRNDNVVNQNSVRQCDRKFGLLLDARIDEYKLIFADVFMLFLFNSTFAVRSQTDVSMCE